MMNPTRRNVIATILGSGVALATAAHPVRSQPTRKRTIVDADMRVWRSVRDTRRDVRGDTRPRSFNIDVALPLMNEAGVDRAVLIPRVADGNTFLLEATKRHPDRFAAMGVVPLGDPNSAALLAKWRDQPGMLGLFLGSRGLPEDVAYFKNGTFDGIWAAAEKYELPVMFRAGWVAPIAPIVERHPGLTFIFQIGNSPAFVLPQLVAHVLSLAKYPNVSVTLSNFLAATRVRYPFHDLMEPLQRIFDAYGPRRCHWGSGAPDYFDRASLRQRVTHFTEELSFLSENDKDWVMGRAIMERLKWP